MKHIALKTIIITTILLLMPLSTASAEDADVFTVTADKTYVTAGDEVTFTVYLTQSGTLSSFEGKLYTTPNLEYVPNSATIAADAGEIMGFGDNISWTESTLFFNGYGDTAYTGSEKVKLLTFKCVVKEDALAGEQGISLMSPVTGDADFQAKEVTVEPAYITIAVEEDIVPGGTAVKPEETDTVTEETDASSETTEEAAAEANEIEEPSTETEEEGSGETDSENLEETEDLEKTEVTKEDSATSSASEATKATETTEEKEESSPLKVVIIITLLILVMVAIVLFGKRKNNDNDET